jgi:SAM-dependent methyltransferase
MGFETAITAEPLRACNLCGGITHAPLFRKRGFELVSCAGCGLAFIANPPDARRLGELYTTAADYHGALLDPADPGFAATRAIARQHLKMLRRSAAEPRGQRLLDIGCSSGLFLDEGRSAGFEVRGAELSADTAAFARSHFGLEVHHGDWREAGFVDGSFDVITLFDVIEHLPDPLGELGAIRRLLKPGGLLLQSTPNIDGLFPRLSYALAKRLDYWPHPEPPHHLYQFSDHTLAELTERAGYEVVRFAPVAMIGPWLGMGDWLYLAARKP